MDLLSTSSGKSTSGSGSSSTGGSAGGGSGSTPSLGGVGEATTETVDDTAIEDNAPLFYAPGKRGFYSPRQGRASFERLNAFRNTGRFVLFFLYILFWMLLMNYINIFENSYFYPFTGWWVCVFCRMNFFLYF